MTLPFFFLLIILDSASWEAENIRFWSHGANRRGLWEHERGGGRVERSGTVQVFCRGFARFNTTRVFFLLQRKKRMVPDVGRGVAEGVERRSVEGWCCLGCWGFRNEDRLASLGSAAPLERQWGRSRVSPRVGALDYCQLRPLRERGGLHHLPPSFYLLTRLISARLPASPAEATVT